MYTYIYIYICSLSLSLSLSLRMRIISTRTHARKYVRTPYLCGLLPESTLVSTGRISHMQGYVPEFLRPEFLV